MAEHMLLGAYLDDTTDYNVLAGYLIHDAGESIISDLSSPFKYYTPIGAPYRSIEAPIDEMIQEYFGLHLSAIDRIHIKNIDARMLSTEMTQLFDNYMDNLNTEHVDATLNLLSRYPPYSHYEIVANFMVDVESVYYKILTIIKSGKGSVETIRQVLNRYFKEGCIDEN